MATQYAFGKIVTNGLVLALDAADRNSYAGSGNTWNDLSGNGNTGTLTNGPTFSTGSGGSIVFDGVDDYANISNNSLLNFGVGSNIQFTIEMCFRITDLSTYRFLISNRSDDTSTNSDYIIFYEVSNNSIYFGTGTSLDSGAWWNVTSAFPNGIISANTTYYISAVLQASGTTSGSKRFFCNGNTINTTYTSKSASNTNNKTIGKSNVSDNYYMKGNIYFTKIYNRALSAAEVLQNYNAQKSRFGL